MKKTILLLSVIVATSANAQSFRLDSTFANNGKIVSQNLRDLAQIIKKPDGKFLTVGRKIPGPSRIGVEQYLANGIIDSSFGTNGFAFVGFNGGEDLGYAIGLQSGGKIIVGGSCQKASGNTALDFAIARLNADGSVDSTFGTNGRFTYDNNNFNFDKVAHLIVQPDDKILFAGGGGSTNLIARLTEDGSLDSTFGVNGIYSGGGVVNRMILASDGKIYTASTGGISASVHKITSAGVNDPGFLAGNNYSESVVMAPQKADLLMLSSGKLLLYAYNNIMGSVFTLLNSDGTVDSATFGKNHPDSIGYTSKVNIGLMFEQAEGKILTPGFYNASSINQIFCVSRFNMNTKQVDPAFADSGYFTAFSHQPSVTSKNEYLNGVITAQDGNLLFAGNSCSGSCIPVIYKFINDAGTTPTGLMAVTTNTLDASVYPNPATGRLNIEIPAAAQATVILTNIHGQIVSEKTIQNGQNSISLEGITTGMYFYTIVDSKGNSAKGKLLVQ